MITVTNVGAALRKGKIAPIDPKNRKNSMLGIIDTAISQFQQNLESGLVILDDSRDLERLVKCYVLLNSESNPSNLDSTQNNVESSKISEILNENDPMVKTLFDKLYNGYNQMNDTEE